MILNQHLRFTTEPGISIRNITPEVKQALAASGLRNGQVLLFSRHTTTALAINEDEPLLFEDIQVYLQTLAPPEGIGFPNKPRDYRHNRLDLRPHVPADEPINAHSHLMAMTLSTSEVIPVIEGELGLGQYQSILLFDLDGPRDRTLLLQLAGQ